MLGVLRSPATDRNPSFIESPRRADEDNQAWLARHMDLGPADGATLVLLGGRSDPYSFRLRVAQSHLRNDMTPSHWSHVALVTQTEGPAKLLEVPASPERGLAFPVPTNGVRSTAMSAYGDPQQYPNIAVIRLDVGAVRMREAAEAFKRQRAVIDVPDLVLRWLAFVWGVGQTGNPLLALQGIPSAAFVEAVAAAAGFELTPALESRASCPEAIWQSALWWHGYYESGGGQALAGAWHVDDRLGAWGEPHA